MVSSVIRNSLRIWKRDYKAITLLCHSTTAVYFRCTLGGRIFARAVVSYPAKVSSPVLAASSYRAVHAYMSTLAVLTHFSTNLDRTSKSILWELLVISGSIRSQDWCNNDETQTWTWSRS